MKWIGLTGGIASGKSTVSKIFAREGFDVIDADLLARQVVEPGQPALEDIKHAFGPDFIQPDGSLDRPKLGSLVFGDTAKLEELEAIVHPHVQDRLVEEKRKLVAAGRKIGFYMVPLLFETGSKDDYDQVIVVSCDQEAQIQRVKSRDEMTDDEAMDRIEAQMPVADKVLLADFVIENNGTLEDLEAATMRLIEENFKN